MRWRIRRIVNGCAAQQLVARRDVIAPSLTIVLYFSAIAVSLEYMVSCGAGKSRITENRLINAFGITASPKPMSICREILARPSLASKLTLIPPYSVSSRISSACTVPETNSNPLSSTGKVQRV